jgi:hypothetical protein
VLHWAERVFPEPESATAEQPLIETPASLKLIVPVGLLPVTEAVKVTLLPTVEGLAELASTVLLVALFTVWVTALLVEAPLLASPP